MLDLGCVSWSWAEVMRSLAVFPASIKVFIWLALTCVVAILLLLLSPLLEVFAFLFDIGQLPSLISWMRVSAILLLLVSAPLAWALGFAGLLLEWMSSYRVKRKRKRQWSACDGEQQRLSQAWAANELKRGQRAQRRLQAYVKGSVAADYHGESGLRDTKGAANWSLRKTKPNDTEAPASDKR